MWLYLLGKYCNPSVYDINEDLFPPQLISRVWVWMILHTSVLLLFVSNPH